MPAFQPATHATHATSATSEPSATPAPTGRLTFDRLREEIEHGRIRTVELALTDVQGRQQGKRYHARHFLEKVAGEGADVCAYVLATDVDMLPPADFDLVSWDTGIGDFQVRPDPATVRIAPWDSGTALVHGDAFLGDRPVEVSPRRILRRQLARLATRDLRVAAGLETEFTLYRGTHARLEDSGYARLRPVSSKNRDFALELDPRTSRYLRLLQENLERAGRPIEAAKSEAAPGQVEITFPYGDPMEACDGHTLFKRTARHTGDRTGLAATFMPTPRHGTASGLHLHLSLWRDDEPVFVRSGGGLSVLGEHAVAGLLTALPDLTPLWAPNPNSYRRYLPDTGAPTAFTWGYDNRTCAVRVVGRDRPHLEVRLPGADANPYLALTAALAAVEYGIENALEPPRPCAGNAYADRTAPPVHSSLTAALDAFRSGPLPDKLLAPGVAKHYAQVAQLEIDAAAGSGGADGPDGGGADGLDAEVERWFSRA